LATRIGGKQPHSSGKFGLHINHVLAGAGKLLRQQIPQTLRVLYRPDALRPSTCPRQQSLALGGGRSHPNIAERDLPLVNGHRSMRRLMRINPDHHRSHHPPVLSRESKRGRSRRANLITEPQRSRLLRATPRRDPAGSRSLTSQTNRVGRSISSHPTGPLNATRETQRLAQVSISSICAAPFTARTRTDRLIHG